MKRKKVAILCGIIVFATLVAALNYFVRFRYILGSEKIGRFEITVMRESGMGHEASVILASNDIRVEFPLPNGAVVFKNDIYPVHDNDKQYLVPLESFQFYLYEQLPEFGYEVEQMGAWVLICSKEIPMQIGMSSAMFTKDYMRIKVSQESDD